jgi:NAD(P)-dependent dehydrogenase (short-subunit alcohol dehydrogenase family)
MARQGYAVCVNYVKSESEAQVVRSAIEQAGGKAIAWRTDVSREDEVEALFAAVDRALGPVSALVNNAGVAGDRHAFVDVEAEHFRRMLDVHLLGTFFCTRAAVVRMAKSRGGSGGAIVNVSSTAARTGGMRLAPYVAAKAGIEGLTRALGAELAAEGIRVNAVAPGIIATAQQPLDDAQWRERAASTIPLGRLGAPEEVAEAILWLLSKEASYVTGTVLDVAGGR